jgi:hypothetical protein
MRRNVLLQRKTGLLGFDSRLVRDTLQTIILAFGDVPIFRWRLVTDAANRFVAAS